MLIHTKDDIEFVTEFPCLLGHPVYRYHNADLEHFFFQFWSITHYTFQIYYNFLLAKKIESYKCPAKNANLIAISSNFRICKDQGF